MTVAQPCLAGQGHQDRAGNTSKAAFCPENLLHQPVVHASRRSLENGAELECASSTTSTHNIIVARLFIPSAQPLIVDRKWRVASGEMKGQACRPMPCPHSEFVSYGKSQSIIVDEDIKPSPEDPMAGERRWKWRRW